MINNSFNANNKISRINHIDVAKGLGIIIIVLGHCFPFIGMHKSWIFCYIYSFHMPFWFFISGYLFSNRKPPKDYFFGKVKSLLFPYLLYSSINLILSLVFNCISKVFGVSYWYEYFHFYALWFILTLFYITVSYYICVFFAQKIITNVKNKDIFMFFVSVFVLLLGLGASHFSTNERNNPIETTMVGFFFFNAGYLYKVYIEKYLNSFCDRFKKLGRFVVLLVGIVLLIILGFTATRNSASVDMNVSRYGIEWLFIINAFIGIFGLLFVSYFIKQNRIIEFYGKNSMIILLMHTLILLLLQTALLRIGIEYWANAIISFIVLMIFSTISVFVINKYFPFMTGRLVMERNDD